MANSMRIAALQPSVTVILAALGALDQLVACTKYCLDVCPELLARHDILRVQDSWTTKADEILMTRPDLVIASVPYGEKAISEILKSGVRFLGLAPHKLTDIYGDIRTLAALVNAGDRGEALVSQIENEIRDVRAKTATLPRQLVFCEEWGKPIIHSQTWVAELVDAAGGAFLGTPGGQTSAAEIAEANPEVILAAWCGAGDRVPLEKVIQERGWQQTSAGRSGRVFCVADELLNTPAQTLLSGLRAIAWALQPDQFSRPSGIRQIAPNTATNTVLK